MKYTKYLAFTVLFTICISSLTSCDKISRFFGDKHIVDCEYGDYPESSVDSTVNSKEDSVVHAKNDSLKRIEAAQQAKELYEKLSLQSDSINELGSRLTDLENNSKSMLDKSSAYTFMVLELILLLLIILYLYNKFDNRIQRIKGILQTSLENSDHGVSKTYVDNKINNCANRINSKDKSQNDRMDEIIRRIVNLEYSLNSYTQYNQRSYRETQNGYFPQKGDKKSDIFYMPRTLTPMQFDDSKKKYAEDDSTYFKFTVKEHGKAEFVFAPYDDSCIGRAYDDRDNSLLTVCELESKSATPKKYSNIAPGEAELRGNVWVVTRKLKLEYV